MRLRVRFVQQRFCAQHGKIGQHAAAQQHAVGTHKTILADRDWRGRLPVVLQINAVLPHLNQSEHRDYRTYYNDYTKKLVGEHFHTDVELFDYEFDGYRGGPVRELQQ